MKYRIILFFSILFLTSLSFAQQLLTLEDALEIALKNNFAISVASAEMQIAENNSVLGNAGFLPDLNAAGTYTESNNNTRQEFFDGRIIDRRNASSNNLNGNVSLNWAIFDGLAMFASLEAFKELEEIGEINYRLAVENNIADITNTYFNLVRQGVVLALVKRNIAISEERVSLASTKREVGSGSRFELLQAQVDLNEDKSGLLSAELTYEQSKTLLNQLMGRNPAEDFTVGDTIIVKTELNVDDILLAALNDNPEILRAERNVNVSDAQIGLARSEWFPQVNLFGSYNFLKSETEAGQINLNKTHGYSYGVNASINLFNGLNTSRQIENAQIEKEISQLQLDETRNRVESSLRNAYQAYQNSLNLIKLESENQQVTEENVAIALERLRLGSITPLEFREAQINLLDAQSRLVNAQYEAKSAETELLRLSGQLVRE